MQDLLGGVGLVVVALVVLVIVVVFGGLARQYRAVRGRPPTRPPGHPRSRLRPGRRPRLLDAPPSDSWLRRPRPGDIWWADVPYEDGDGSKVRPCLVLRTYGRGVDVLKITSQDKSGRAEYVQLPTATWDPRAERDSWLDLSGYIPVRHKAFSRKAGTCDPDVWWTVRRYHDTGWVA